ncbi:MAG: hypothetical protein AAF415_16695 [Pseudomonadota bacterium]
MRVTLISIGRAAAILVLATALSAIGAAHDFDREPLSPELIAFAQTGVSLLDLCEPSRGDDHTDADICEACRLVDAAFNLPDAHDGPARALPRIRKLAFLADQCHWTKPPDPACMTRAPPQA